MVKSSLIAGLNILMLVSTASYAAQEPVVSIEATLLLNVDQSIAQEIQQLLEQQVEMFCQQARTAKGVRACTGDVCSREYDEQSCNACQQEECAARSCQNCDCSIKD